MLALVVVVALEPVDDIASNADANSPSDIEPFWLTPSEEKICAASFDADCDELPLSP